MMVKIIRNIVSANLARKVTYGGTNKRQFITIHETDNWGKGAGALSHGRLQANGNSRSASWHYQVDDTNIVQSFEDTVQCWAGGDGQGNGNLNSIHIEICVNSDSNYKKAVANAVELTKYLQNKHGIADSKVVQHNYWSGKNCPRSLRSGNKGVSWSGFKGMLGGKSSVSTAKPSQSVAKPSKPNTSGSIVDYLNSKKVDSSFSNRKKLASKHGIKGYEGTASQNTSLLKAIKGGTAKPNPVKKPSTSKAPSMASSYKGKRLESKTDGLRFYGKRSWDDKDVIGTVNKGIGFPSIVSRHKVGSGYQYKVKNSKGASYYITASNKFVSVKNATKVKKKAVAKKRSLGVGSKVKIKSSARFYTTGERIPSSIKGRTYTIMQVGRGKVLLREIMSWVKTRDVS